MRVTYPYPVMEALFKLAELTGHSPTKLATIGVEYYVNKELSRIDAIKEAIEESTNNEA
jgi:hypothetical protein